MSGFNHQRNRSVFGKSKQSCASPEKMVWKPKPKIEASLGSASFSEKHNGASVVEKVPGEVQNVMSIESSLNEDYFSKKVNESMDKNTHKDDVTCGMKNIKLLGSSLDENRKKDENNDHTSSIKQFDICARKIEASLDSASCSEKHEGASVVEKVPGEVRNVTLIESSLNEEFLSKKVNESMDKNKKKDDVACGMKKIKLIDASLDEECISKKVEQFADKNKKKDENNDHTSSIKRFDICARKVDTVVKLKAPLHTINRERRNQIKQSTEGQNVVILGPGMVLMKNYISCDDQISIVKKCRELGISDGGFYQPVFSSGNKMNLKMMCLGKNWDPESNRYSDKRESDNAKPPEIPEVFHDMVIKALQDSNDHIRANVADAYKGKIIPSMKPDLCIINFYSNSGKLGLHQDRDESDKSLRQGLPVVSFSLGDSATFLYGEARDVEKADKVTLESGDVLIFGGKSRLIFHGVTSVLPDTAPAWLIEATNICRGRLNLTFRKY